MRLGEAGIERHCRAVGVSGRVEPAGRLQRGAEVDPQFGHVRLERDRAPKARGRFVGPAEKLLQIAQIGMRQHEFRPAGDRPVEGIDRRVEPVEMLEHAAQTVVDVGIVGTRLRGGEEIIGRALKNRRSEYVLATKCMHRLDEGLDYAGSRQSISESIDQSLSRLQTDYIDLLQVHGRDDLELELRIIRDGVVMDELDKARQAGKIRFTGYSSYSEEAAQAAIEYGRWDTLQIACNILDRRYLKRVIPEARKRGVAIIVRSALLKGALTDKSKYMPEKLSPLIEHIDRLVEVQSATHFSLPEMALRYVLSIPDIATIIVGADRTKYLEEAVSASDGKGLNDEILVKLEDMALDDPYLLNPGNWGIP